MKNRMNPRKDQILVFLALILGLVLVLASGCASVGVRTRTVVNEETTVDVETGEEVTVTDEKTTLTTLTLVGGNGKIQEAQPAAGYEGEDGNWRMTAGSSSTGMESDMKALMDTLRDMVSAYSASQAAQQSLLQPLLEMLPGILDPG